MQMGLSRRSQVMQMGLHFLRRQALFDESRRNEAMQMGFNFLRSILRTFELV
jgi:hypothetical protein